MNERERMIVILGGIILALMITGTVCYAALTVPDKGDLLYGGLIGTGAFGGGALLSALGLQQQRKSDAQAAAEVQA